MPILMPDPTAGAITSLVAAAPGWRVDASAPKDIDLSSVPTPSTVVGWVLLADGLAPGGATVQPVFYAGGRTWTPQQFRAAYGTAIEVTVARVP